VPNYLSSEDIRVSDGSAVATDASPQREQLSRTGDTLAIRVMSRRWSTTMRFCRRSPSVAPPAPMLHEAIEERVLAEGARVEGAGRAYRIVVGCRRDSTSLRRSRACDERVGLVTKHKRVPHVDQARNRDVVRCNAFLTPI